MSMSDMCDIIKNRLFDYIDGELDDASRAELEEHIDNCPECRKEFQDCLATIKLLHTAREIPPKDIASSVMTQVRSMTKTKNKLRRMRILTSVAASIVAVTALTAVAVKISPYLTDNKSVDDASEGMGARLYSSYNYSASADDKADSVVFYEEELEICEAEVEDVKEKGSFDSYDGAVDADTGCAETMAETTYPLYSDDYFASVDGEAQIEEAEEEAEECAPECIVTTQNSEYCNDVCMRNMIYNIEAEAVTLNSMLGNVSNSVIEPFTLD